MGDFHETGALCKEIDTMVSVDTSVVHPARAIGQKVHQLLPYNANARWHEKHSDSTCYSSVQIYRQDENCGWAQPLAEVMQELSKQI